MKCIAENLPLLDPNLNIEDLRAEWDRIAKQNLENIETLRASECFVAINKDRIPTDGLQEGMPIKWGDKHHPFAFLPHGNHDAFEFGCVSTFLK